MISNNVSVRSNNVGFRANPNGVKQAVQKYVGAPLKDLPQYMSSEQSQAFKNILLGTLGATAGVVGANVVSDDKEKNKESKQNSPTSVKIMAESEANKFIEKFEKQEFSRPLIDKLVALRYLQRKAFFDECIKNPKFDINAKGTNGRSLIDSLYERLALLRLDCIDACEEFYPELCEIREDYEKMKSIFGKYDRELILHDAVNSWEPDYTINALLQRDDIKLVNENGDIPAFRYALLTGNESIYGIGDFKIESTDSSAFARLSGPSMLEKLSEDEIVTCINNFPTVIPDFECNFQEKTLKMITDKIGDIKILRSKYGEFILIYQPKDLEDERSILERFKKFGSWNFDKVIEEKLKELDKGN